MGPILLGVITLAFGLLLASLITRLSVRQLRHGVLGVALGLGGLLFLLLLYSGRIGFAVLLASYLIWLWRIGRAAPSDRQAAAGADRGAGRQPSGAGMDIREALDILGLEAGASRAEIDAAYKALMVKNHPDQGGTDWLAARLNEARDTLMAQIP